MFFEKHPLVLPEVGETFRCAQTAALAAFRCIGTGFPEKLYMRARQAHRQPFGRGWAGMPNTHHQGGLYDN